MANETVNASILSAFRDFGNSLSAELPKDQTVENVTNEATAVLHTILSGINHVSRNAAFPAILPVLMGEFPAHAASMAVAFSTVPSNAVARVSDKLSDEDSQKVRDFVAECVASAYGDLESFATLNSDQKVGEYVRQIGEKVWNAIGSTSTGTRQSFAEKVTDLLADGRVKVGQKLTYKVGEKVHTATILADGKIEATVTVGSGSKIQTQVVTGSLSKVAGLVAKAKNAPSGMAVWKLENGTPIGELRTH